MASAPTDGCQALHSLSASDPLSRCSEVAEALLAFHAASAACTKQPDRASRLYSTTMPADLQLMWAWLGSKLSGQKPHDAQQLTQAASPLASCMFNSSMLMACMVYHARRKPAGLVGRNTHGLQMAEAPPPSLVAHSAKACWKAPVNGGALLQLLAVHKAVVARLQLAAGPRHCHQGEVLTPADRGQVSCTGHVAAASQLTSKCLWR